MVIFGYSFVKLWDGINKGKVVIDGIYFYVLDLFDEKYKDLLKGYIMVI